MVEWIKVYKGMFELQPNRFWKFSTIADSRRFSHLDSYPHLDLVVQHFYPSLKLFAWGQAKVQLGGIWYLAYLVYFRPVLVPDSCPNSPESCAFHRYIFRIWYCWVFVCFLQVWSKTHEETAIWDDLVRPLPEWCGHALPSLVRPLPDLADFSSSRLVRPGRTTLVRAVPKGGLTDSNLGRGYLRRGALQFR